MALVNLARQAILAIALTVTFPDALTAQSARTASRTDRIHDIVITGAVILDGTGGRIDNGEVLIQGGKIAAIGRTVLRPPGAEVIDASGRWITPGLIDVHTHYGTFLLPLTEDEADTNDIVEKSDANAAATSIEHAVRANDPAFAFALAGGVTALQILPGSRALIGGRSIVVKPVPAVTVDDMRFAGAPQGVKMSCGSNPASAHGGGNNSPSSRQGGIAFVRQALLDAVAYREEWRRFRSGAEKRAPRRDLKLETLVAVLDGQMPVHLHCYRAEDMANWIAALGEFGVRISAVHHATEAYKIAPLLAQKQTCAAVWPDWWGFKREAEDGIPENAAFVDAAGGCVMLHSDIPVLGSMLNLEAAKAAAAGRRAGLAIPPERAIRWITSNPAQALGLGTKTGTLAKGYNADIVVWSGDPFSVYSKADLVLIDGAIAYDRSKPRLPDFELGRPQKARLP